MVWTLDKWRKASMAALVLTACAAPARAPSREAHYRDAAERPLANLEPAWSVVHDFFDEATPPIVHVTYVDRGTSQFHPESSALTISRESLRHQTEVGVAAHETAHLALARLTRGASTTEALRFIDEGLASIVQSRAEGKADAYRARASVVAAERAREDGAILAHAERWSEYFGDPKTRADFDAYDVGASFDQFLFDAFGSDRVRRLFADLGETRNLTRSCERVLGRELGAIELGWRASLEQVRVEPPRVVAQSPANESETAPAETTELHATFDLPMASQICIDAPCHEGICYDHATWRTPTELVLVVTKPLQPGRWYELTLGTRRCRLKSRGGATMAPVKWIFKTR